jgi:ElaB/YqjD/DUF883 family membrane-anchored ribosome-binding protein
MTQQSSFGRGSDQIGEIKDQTTDQFNKVGGQAEDLANRVAEQGREASDRMQEVAGNFKSALDRSVREQPMATLIVAGIVGFLVGAIWKS